MFSLKKSVRLLNHLTHFQLLRTAIILILNHPKQIRVFLINLPYFFNRVFAQFSHTIFCVKVDKGQMGRVPFLLYTRDKPNIFFLPFVCTNLNCRS